MKLHCLRSVLCVLLLCAALAVSASASVLRVKWDSPNNGPGNDWDHAFHTVTAALASAASGDEIWVAGDAAHPYDERITLAAGVGLYGGFAGMESSRDQRDWKANITVLDGGGASWGGVITAPDVATPSSVVDGFTVRNAYLGFDCLASTPLITNCTITDTSCAVQCTRSAPGIITGNTIARNVYGVICNESSPSISNNRFQANRTGVYCYNRAAPSVVCNIFAGNGDGIETYDCAPVIASNTFSASGRGIYCKMGSPSIANNIIAYGYKGIVLDSSGSPLLRNNCLYNPDGTDYSGLAAGEGDIQADPRFVSAEYGRLHLQPGSPCVDAGVDNAVGEGWTDMDGQARIQGEHVDIGADESDGTTWPGHVPVVVRVSPDGDDAHDGSSWALAKRSVQSAANAASEAGGEVWVAAGVYSGKVWLLPYAHMYGGFAGNESAREERDWQANSSILDAGGATVGVEAVCGKAGLLDGFTVRNGTVAGVYCSPSCLPRIANNTITGSKYGVRCERSWPSLANNAIVGNLEYGIICSAAAPEIAGNTICANGQYGVGCYQSSSPVITNNIVAFHVTGIQCSSSSPVLSHNCVHNPNGTNYSGVAAGTGDISADPLFVDRAAGDLHLQPNSPCIDSGDPALLDPDGSRSDIGAFPYSGGQPAGVLGPGKRLAEGTMVRLAGLVVTAAAGEAGPGFCCAQQVDRAAGIRILTGASLARGQTVSFLGALSTVEGERVVTPVEGSLSAGPAADIPEPLLLTCGSLGGASVPGQQGVIGCAGLNNIGLLIRLAGRVESIDAGGAYFVLSDGSGVEDPDGRPGVRVKAAGLMPPGLAAGDFVIVTGISSCCKAGEDLHPQILARTAEDIQVVSP